MRQLLGLLVGLLLLVIVAGCATAPSEPTVFPSDAEAIALQPIDRWPENRYTAEVTAPDTGTPVYQLEEAGSFSIWVTSISREEGERYLESLRQLGYEPLFQAEESASAGVILEGGDTILSVALSDTGLVLRIHLAEETSSS